MNYSTLNTCGLFTDIADENISSIVGCLGAEVKSYKKNDFIMHIGDAPHSIGVVLKGVVHVIQEDFWGNRSIVARKTSSEIFGEAFACAGMEKIPVSVLSMTNTEVMFLEYQKIVTTCSASCLFHHTLIKNMVNILAQNNANLTQKVEILGNRTMREKILSYLSAQALKSKAPVFEVPFNRQELADYLSVDRSALSRELSNMEKEGIIKFNKQRFELI